MQRVLAILVSLVWAAWFGGLLTLFLAVTSIFGAFGTDRHTAGTAAAGVFRSFERYQLILAAAGLLLTVVWRIVGGAAGLKHLLFVGFTLPTLLAAYGTVQITPHIEDLRKAGETTTAEFGRLHGIASSLYLGEAILLCLVGILLVLTIARDMQPTGKKKS